MGSSWRKIALDALLLPTALVAQPFAFDLQLVHGYLHEGALIGWWLSAVAARAPEF